jgi:hypothetical protein
MGSGGARLYRELEIVKYGGQKSFTLWRVTFRSTPLAS